MVLNNCNHYEIFCFININETCLVFFFLYINQCFDFKLLPLSHENDKKIKGYSHIMLFFTRILKELEEILGSRNDLEFEDLSKLEYLGQVLKEGLRLHPPVASIQRMLPKGDSFGGYKLPPNTNVTVSYIGIQKSSKFWENSDVFDPDRFSPVHKENILQFSYSPFSLGPRSCIGKTLAQVEAKVLMVRVLREFKFELLPGQTAAEEENVTLRSRDGVICTLTTRK